MWRCHANETAMRRHFTASTGRRIRVFKSDRNWNSTQRYDGSSRLHEMITAYHITNIFYKYCRSTNFVRVSQTQTTTFIYCHPICIRF